MGGIILTINKIESRVVNVLRKTNNPEYMKLFINKQGAFSRVHVQKMTFPDLTTFLIANKGTSLSLESLEFFNQMGEIDNAISKQGLSKQRKYIESELFEKLSYDYAMEIYKDRKQLFHGCLLVAVDGSTAEIPNIKSLRDFFGAAKSSKTSHSNARAGLNGFYDPLNHIMLKLVVDTYQKNEVKVFLEHLDAFLEQYKGEKICFLFDRGYISLKLIFELEKRHVDYLFRVPKSCYKKEISATTSRDEEISIEITKARLKNIEDKQEQDFYLTQEYMKVRLVQVELDNQEIEYLITSVPSTKVLYEEMKEFYFQRWEIERTFNLLKNRLHIENISARTPLGVRQDIQATVFLANIVEDIVVEANQKLIQRKENKHEYRINVNLLCGLLKTHFIYLFYNNSDEEKKIRFCKEIVYFMKRTVIENKKGKKNPRIKRVSRNKHKTNIRKNY